MINSFSLPCKDTTHPITFFMVLALTLTSMTAFSQTPQSFLWEPDFELKISTESPWSHSFGIAMRSLMHERFDGEKVSGYNTEHLQLEHFTYYKLENLRLGLGVRYRFREIFDDQRYDELRFMERVKYSYPVSTFEISHELRAEQRLRVVEVIHRFRYELGASKALSDVFELEANTEALYSISPQHKPALEQRFAVGIENSSFENLNLSAGVELRVGDYNIDTTHDYFFTTGVALEL